MVVCGDEVVVPAVHNTTDVDDVTVVVDVAAMDGVVIVVGAVATVVVWVQ